MFYTLEKWWGINNITQWHSHKPHFLDTPSPTSTPPSQNTTLYNASKNDWIWYPSFTKNNDFIPTIPLMILYMWIPNIKISITHYTYLISCWIQFLPSHSPALNSTIIIPISNPPSLRPSLPPKHPTLIKTSEKILLIQSHNTFRSTKIQVSHTPWNNIISS